MSVADERLLFRTDEPGAGTDAAPSAQARATPHTSSTAGPGPWRLACAASVALLAILLAFPAIADDYVMSVLVLVMYFAYIGQAWNVMAGFAGLLSLGHALFVGLGGYVGAYLFVRHGINPWLGMLAAVLVTSLAAAIIGALSFSFGVKGVYFAILTVAFAEFTRIVFDHLPMTGGVAGLFLPVTNTGANQFSILRGNQNLFYYVLLGANLVALAICTLLVRSRVGYYWKALRDDLDAAQAIGVNLFRYRMLAVLVSAALSAVGGVIQTFYYNNLYPDSTFSFVRSIEFMLGPIIGGIGTLVGPLLGAALFVGLGEVLGAVTEKFNMPALRQFVYGIVLLLVLMGRPHGIWPWLKEKLTRADRKREANDV